MHKMTEVSLGGKLNLAPIPKNARRILDVGTGTGIWAIETGMIKYRSKYSPLLANGKTAGDKYPDAEVRPLPQVASRVMPAVVDRRRFSETT